MSKVFVIAAREYAAAVRTKSFVISLFLMPILMFGGVFVQRQAQKIVDTDTQRVALIDHTDAGRIGASVARAAEARNASDTLDATGKPIAPRFEIELITPAPESSPDLEQQRLALAERVRSGELLAIVEIGSAVTRPDFARLARETAENLSTTRPGEAEADAGADTEDASTLRQRFAERARASGTNAIPDTHLIRYSTNRPTYMPFREWLQTAIYLPTLDERARTFGLPGATVRDLSIAPVVVDRPLAERAVDGGVSYRSDTPNIAASFILPTVLAVLMMLPVLIGASPLAMNVIEEKQLRIAEVLLSSARPTEIMAGKLLGGVGVSMTLAIIYLAGSAYAARELDALKYVSLPLVICFVIFTIISVLLYGAIFVAAGAAVTNIKESQAVVTPAVLLLVMPMMMMPVVVQQPNGTIAQALSLIPLTAPLTIVARLAVPPGPPVLDVVLAAISCLLATAAIIWAAGRVFRVGILSNSRPASVKEAVGWVLRG